LSIQLLLPFFLLGKKKEKNVNNKTHIHFWLYNTLLRIWNVLYIKFCTF
jgi:hypothetical protein